MNKFNAICLYLRLLRPRVCMRMRTIYCRLPYSLGSVTTSRTGAGGIPSVQLPPPTLPPPLLAFTNGAAVAVCCARAAANAAATAGRAGLDGADEDDADDDAGGDAIPADDAAEADAASNKDAVEDEPRVAAAAEVDDDDASPLRRRLSVAKSADASRCCKRAVSACSEKSDSANGGSVEVEVGAAAAESISGRRCAANPRLPACRCC